MILINIDVPSLDDAERFYSAAFGLRPARLLGDCAREMLGWPAPVYLLEKPAGSCGAAHDKRHFSRHWTPVHLDVVVADLDTAVQRALDNGATLDSPSTATGYGRIAMLADPFGHGFCLIEFAPEGYDGIAEVS